MFVHDAIALAVFAVGVIATSKVIAPAARLFGGADAFLRDAAGEAPVRQLPRGGAIDIDATPSLDISASAARMNQPAAVLTKRIFDVVLSLGLLAFFAPLLAVTALAIKVTSPGPVLYRQRRIGLGGREFEVFKFRSMVANAETDGPQYAAVNDRRITPVGRVIRKFRIDEIPQAINVLRGEMSFVGPRPERPEFVRELETQIPLYQCRHLVKPGITGWAQVKYEYAASVEGARNKLRFDLYYIRHFSPLLDLVIVVMTIRVALFGLGGR